ncbi:hypothetical protein GCM10023212_18080 [Luteolibacter yonseiensis]
MAMAMRGITPCRVGPCQPGALAAFVLLALLPSCGREESARSGPAPSKPDPKSLFSVGSISVLQSDLDLHLKEKHPGRTGDDSRKQALAELATRAQLAQAALDAGLQDDPVVRSEIARVLGSRLKEIQLSPELKTAAATPSESRLREIYTANESRFRSNEKRQVAVLWLNPNGNPEREKQYVEKLTAARQWYAENSELKSHPDQGFSVLSVDYSEHQASRYKGGVVGWLESGGTMDPWSKAVAEIAFELPAAGGVSEVIHRPEGVFLVRVMAGQPAVLRSFESVADELARNEQQRLRQEAETKFQDTISEKYPVHGLN